MMDDAELLRRYVAGKSEEAFAALVRRHLDLVYATALRQLAGDTHLAQDVAQTVFTALARKAPALAGRATVAGWLYLSAQHAAAQAVRGEQRRRAREQEASTMPDLSSSSDAATDWGRVRPVLDAALRDLGETDREAVLLRFFERRPFAEIGAALRVGEDAARMRVDRALEKLRVLLARRGVTSTAAALGAVLSNEAVLAAPAGLASAIAGSAFATGAATIASAGIFMKATTLLTGAVALAALGTAIFQANQFHRTEAKLAALTRDHDGLHAQLRAAQQRAVKAEQQSASLQRDLDAARTPRPTAGGGTLGFSGSRSGQLTLGGSSGYAGKITLGPSLSNDPAEARRLVRQMNIEGMDSTYRAFYRQMGFTPAQDEQFKTIMIDYMDRRNEHARAALAEARAQTNDRTTLQAVAEATVQQAYNEWLVAIQGAFGPPIAQSFQHFVDTIPAGEVTKELSGSLFNTDTPLTPAQADQLVDIIAANSRNALGKVDLSAMNSDAILEQAKAVLSEPQLVALRRAQLRVQEKWAPASAKTPGG